MKLRILLLAYLYFSSWYNSKSAHSLFSERWAAFPGPDSATSVAFSSNNQATKKMSYIKTLHVTPTPSSARFPDVQPLEGHVEKKSVQDALQLKALEVA